MRSEWSKHLSETSFPSTTMTSLWGPRGQNEFELRLVFCLGLLYHISIASEKWKSHGSHKTGTFTQSRNASWVLFVTLAVPFASHFAATRSYGAGILGYWSSHVHWFPFRIPHPPATSSPNQPERAVTVQLKQLTPTLGYERCSAKVPSESVGRCRDLLHGLLRAWVRGLPAFTDGLELLCTLTKEYKVNVTISTIPPSQKRFVDTMSIRSRP